MIELWGSCEGPFRIGHLNQINRIRPMDSDSFGGQFGWENIFFEDFSNDSHRIEKVPKVL